MNAVALKPLPGQIGVLRWTEDTRIVSCLEDVDLGAPYVFPYAVTPSKDFCTINLAQSLTVGEYVALAVRPQLVEQKETSKGEPYMVISGPDADGHNVTELRLWRFSLEDIRRGSTCIIRGLKIAIPTQWDGQQGAYVQWLEGPKTFECTNRTAVEDVSHVEAITDFFS